MWIFIAGFVVGFVASFFVSNRRYASLRTKFHEERKELKAKIQEKLQDDD